MLDPIDLSESRLREILWHALDHYSEQELLEFCRDTDVILRTSSAKKLHINGGDLAFRGALSLCNSEDVGAREIGCFILGQLGTPEKPFALESVSCLQGCAEDESAEVRAAAIASLGHLAVPSSKKTVLAATKDTSTEVRKMAAFSLGRFDGTEVLDALAELKMDTDSDVREWVDISLECIHERLQVMARNEDARHS